MAIRLTNDMRDKITHNALKHRFAEPIAALRRQRAVLANFVYGEAFARVKMDIDALPEGWLPEDDHVHVRLGTSHTHLYFNGDFPRGYYTKYTALNAVVSRSENVYRRFPAKNKGCVMAVMDATDAVTLRYDALVTEMDSLRDQVEAAGRDTRAALNKFTTVEKLLAAWPEIEPLTRGVGPTPPAKLPMVPVHKLNEALGLPVDEEEAA